MSTSRANVIMSCTVAAFALQAGIAHACAMGWKSARREPRRLRGGRGCPSRRHPLPLASKSSTQVIAGGLGLTFIITVAFGR